MSASKARTLLGKRYRHLQREHMLAVKVLVQAVEVAGTVAWNNGVGVS
jgi:hypothetical protein